MKTVMLGNFIEITIEDDSGIYIQEIDGIKCIYIKPELIYDLRNILDNNFYVPDKKNNSFDYNRAAICISACEGMTSPAKEIAELRNDYLTLAHLVAVTGATNGADAGKKWYEQKQELTNIKQLKNELEKYLRYTLNQIECDSKNKILCSNILQFLKSADSTGDTNV